jgi:hypothetical protein
VTDSFLVALIPPTVIVLIMCGAAVLLPGHRALVLAVAGLAVAFGIVIGVLFLPTV